MRRFSGQVYWLALALGLALAVSSPQLRAHAGQSTSSPSATPQSNTPPAAAAQPDAQTPAGDQPASPDDVPKFVVGSNEVNVVFIVTDKHGHRITNLKQNDFRVLDDNKPVENIRSFHNETNLPLQVGLLIDASNSVARPLQVRAGVGD